MSSASAWSRFTPCVVLALGLATNLGAGSVPTALAPATPAPAPAPEPELIAAARRGDIATMEKLFLRGEDLNQAGPGRLTALHAAASAAQDKTVAWLISHEANVFAKDEAGKVPSDITTAMGHRSTSIVLKKFMLLLSLEQSASADEAWDDLTEILSRDARGYTLLHVLAIRGNTEEARRRIQAGAAVDAKTVLGMTPLMKAAALGHKEVAELLLKSGADVNARDLLDNTPLISAVVSGKEDLVKLMLDAGADLGISSRKGGGTALELAIKMERTRIAEMLKAALLRQAPAGK